jgi:putative PIN family toxin of toxin-antitoxin system
VNLILDTNIWISFAIGKRLQDLEALFNNRAVHIFVCDKLLEEVNDTLLKPKLLKYVTIERKNLLLKYMATCEIALIVEQSKRSRDIEDNFLLDLAEAVHADFLITGDNDLLVLQQHFHTSIITFREFLSILS